MNTMGKMTLTFILAFVVTGGGTSSQAAVLSSASSLGVACPLYCIDGDAACFDPDGSCRFACNACVCESSGGEWHPGLRCPDEASNGSPVEACPMYCIDGPAACVLADGSCEFACNECLCETVGGQWHPGSSCPGRSLCIRCAHMLPAEPDAVG